MNIASKDIQISKRGMRFLLIYLLVTLLRLWIAALLGVWFPASQGADDALMVIYSALPAYFTNLSREWLMLKELGMPVFLQMVNFSGLSYPAAITFLWILAGGLMARIAKKITGNDCVTLGVYICTLFVPAAFDKDCGTRMYRAGLLNPLYVTVFALCVLLLMAVWEKRTGGKLILLSVFLGCLFSFTYYVKEDGIWILAVMAAFAALWIIAAVWNREKPAVKKRIVTVTCSILLPFLIWGGVTAAYKGINHHFFGVYATNARTAGESGEFVEKIYKIASDDRTNSVWAPKDAIEKAFEASATLQAHPELKEEIFHSWWVDYDIDAHPIQGDFLTWVLKDALYDCGIADGPGQKEAFFRQVNEELDKAFSDGTLKKEQNRITVVSSVGGKTSAEIGEILGKAFRCYGYHLLMKAYEPGGIVWQEDLDNLHFGASVLANYYVFPMEGDFARLSREYEVKIANVPVKIVFGVGKILAPLLFAAALAGVIWEIVRFCKNRKEEGFFFLMSLSALGMLAVSYVYSFMIMLFCTQYGDQDFTMAEKMYSVGVVSLMVIFMSIGVSLLVRLVTKGVFHGDHAAVH